MLRAVGLLARRGAQAGDLWNAARGAAVASSSLRSYAAEAKKVEHGLLTGVAGKYALALHGAAEKAKAGDKVEKDLKQVLNLAATNAQFNALLKDPSVPRAQKTEALTAVLAKAGVSDIVQNLVGVLVDNGRVGMLDKIDAQYAGLMAHFRGEIKAAVTTAEPLSAADLNEVKSGLSGLLGPGQKLLLEQRVDPAIIGGMVLDIGDKHIDLSILTRVKKVQQLILEMN